jgi:phage replication O-like protein O
MAEQARHTRIPNAILDSMADLTEPELRVLLAITRKTIGWQKECDPISLTQLEKITGLSRPAVNKALHAAIERGWVECTGRGKRGTGCYKLTAALVNDVNQLTEITSKQGLPDPVNVVNRSSPQLVNDVNTQKKDLKEKKERVSERATRATHTRQINLDSLHEAVAIYKQLTNKSPPPTTATLIATTVVDMSAWHDAVKGWCDRGFKPGNVDGMIDWYLHPDKQQRNTNGHSNGKLLRQSVNGHSERKPQRETDLDTGF